MKKIYLLCFLLLTATFVKVQAQCTPDLSWTHSGIRPDSATGLPHACENLPYTAQFDIYVPDSVHAAIPPSTSPIAIYIDSVVVTSITGVPSPLTYSVNPTSQKFEKFAHGCMQITGTAPAAGVYPLTVVTKSNIRLLFNFVPATVRYDTIRYYKIVVDPTGSSNCMASINEQADPSQLAIMSIAPNPAANALNVKVNVPTAGKLHVSINNLVGQQVYARTVTVATNGYQNLPINDLQFNSGVYLLSIEQGGQTITHKVTIVH